MLARLLPDGYRDDPGASAEFRRYTEETPALGEGRFGADRAGLAAAQAAARYGSASPTCQQWLRALNDVRLALSVRLGITDENEDLSEHLLPTTRAAAYVWVYQWLAYLQDSLIEALA